MGIRNKIITAVFAILICASAFAVTAYATETGSDTVTDIPTEGEIDVPDVPDVPVTDDPYVGEETYAPDEPSTDDPYAESDPYYDPDIEDPYYEPTDPYYEPTNSYYESETYPYIVEDEPPYFSNNGEDVYVGGGQNGYTVPDHTMPSAALFDADRVINDDELSKSDWSEIAANLSKADSNSGDSDGGDFNFIKKNDSKNDNGDWMLYVGIALVALSIAGITYTIVSTVKIRKSTSSYSDKHSFAHASSSKFDTAEVKVPKRAKHSGGKRFK